MSEVEPLYSKWERVRELSSLFFPLFLINLSNYFLIFIEKSLLSRFSPECLDAAVSVVAICQIFQSSTISLVMMAQVYVGRWIGSQENQKIGPGIWQMIWFAFLSMVVTVPLSLYYGSYYLACMPFQKLAEPYLYFFVSINFLYPLGAALSCFYLGQGKKELVVMATLGTQLLKLICAYVLIFGYEPFIPKLGLMGGAISTIIAQLGFCLVLFMGFLTRSHRMQFATGDWRLKPKLFWENIRLGILRMLNRLFSFFSWAETVKFMAMKGELFGVVLSLGNTLFLFLSFLGDALCQSNTSFVSKLVGAQAFTKVRESFFAPFFLASIFITIFFISIVTFSSEMCAFWFPTIIIEPNFAHSLNLGIWLCFVFFTASFIFLSYLFAFKDITFYLFAGMVSGGFMFSLMYATVEKLGLPPQYFWMVLSIGQALTALAYFLRARRLIKIQESRLQEDALGLSRGLSQ